MISSIFVWVMHFKLQLPANTHSVFSIQSYSFSIFIMHHNDNIKYFIWYICQVLEHYEMDWIIKIETRGIIKIISYSASFLFCIFLKANRFLEGNSPIFWSKWALFLLCSFFTLFYLSFTLYSKNWENIFYACYEPFLSGLLPKKIVWKCTNFM